MLLVVNILAVLSLVLVVVLVIYFAKTYGVKMTAMWGGLMILYVVLQILVSLWVIFVFEGRFSEDISKEREAQGELVQNISEIGRLLESNTEKVHVRVLAHAERIDELQDWIDYLNEELEEVKQKQ